MEEFEAKKLEEMERRKKEGGWHFLYFLKMLLLKMYFLILVCLYLIAEEAELRRTKEGFVKFQIFHGCTLFYTFFHYIHFKRTKNILYMPRMDDKIFLSFIPDICIKINLLNIVHTCYIPKVCKLNISF